MISSLDYFRELNFSSVLLRLLLAMIFGGMIGLERGRKHRAAGFRTYMLVCLGATLTSILSQYLYVRLDTDWLGFAETTSRQIDVSRFGCTGLQWYRFSCCWHDYCHRTAGGQGVNNSGRPVGICLYGGLPSVRDFMSVLSLHLC